MIQILRMFALALTVAFAVGQDTSAASVSVGMCIAIDDAVDVTDAMDRACGEKGAKCTFECEDGELKGSECECV